MKLIKFLISALLITTACTYAAEKRIIPNGVAPKELDAKQQAELDRELVEAVWASRDADLDLAKVESLLNQKANANASRKDTKRHSLFIATSKPRTTQLLLAYKADPNAAENSYCDRQKVTALMKAVISDCPETVQLLVTGKANVNAQDTGGETALHKALDNRTKATNKILAALLHAKADCNITDKDGYTPLLTTVRSDDPAELAELLLNAKANPDKGSDKFGLNPLLNALCNSESDRGSNRHKVFLLLQAKADCNVSAPPFSGTEYTPLSLAQTHQDGRGEYEDVVIALLKGGGKNENQTPLLCFLNPKNKPHQRPTEDACVALASDIVKSVCKTGTNGNVFNQLGARELGKPIRSELLRYKYFQESTDKKDNAKKDEGKKA